MKYAQRLDSGSQPPAQEDKAPDTPASLKRNSQGLSPLERQHGQATKKVNYAGKANKGFIRTPRLQQTALGNVDNIEVNFGDLFDDM